MATKKFLPPNSLLWQAIIQQSCSGNNFYCNSRFIAYLNKKSAKANCPKMPMKKPAFLLLIVSLFVWCPVYPVWAEVDGNMLLNNCTEVIKYIENKNDSSINIAALNFCVGYISGINDLHTSFVSSVSSFDPPKYCLPQQIRSEQLVEIVFKFLKAHPEDLNFLGSDLVLAALKETFPCPLNTLHK